MSNKEIEAKQKEIQELQEQYQKAVQIRNNSTVSMHRLEGALEILSKQLQELQKPVEKEEVKPEVKKPE